MADSKKVKPAAPKAKTTKSQAKAKKAAKSTSRKMGRYTAWSDRDLKDHVVPIGW
jgi:hypothetical protein